jgi:hypothetical protein
MDENEQFFVSQSIDHARSLPLQQCIQYLKGFLSTIGNDHPVAANLHPVYQSLRDSDQQLDLIQIGQLKLNLGAPAPKRRKQK